MAANSPARKGSGAWLRIMRNGTAALLLILGGLFIAPQPVQASNPPVYNDWQRQIITGQDSNDIDRISAAGDTNGKIGIAFHRVTDNDVGFAIGNYSTGFAVVTLDIQAAETTILNGQVLVRVSNTEWVIAAKTTAAIQKAWRSTDSGATWTETLSVTQATGTAPTPIMANNGADVVLQFATTTTNYNFYKSSDGGATWAIIHSQNTAVQALTISGSFIHAISATGTSTSPSALKYILTEDSGAHWSSLINVCSSCSGTTVARAIDVEAHFNAISEVCVSSCSVTPVYNLRYNYKIGTAWITQSLTPSSDISSAPEGLARDSENEIMLIDQGGGIPIIWYSSDAISDLTKLTTPLPDADDTAAPVVQSSRIYVALSNGSFGGRMEVWSADTLNAPGGPSGGDVVAPLTGIVGFDLSRNGEFAIVRDGGGATIKVLNAETLATIYAPSGATAGTADCARLHGVATIADDGVAWITCSPGGQITGLRVRDEFGNAFPLTCIGTCFTPLNFDLNGLPDEDKIADIALNGAGLHEYTSGTKKIHAFNFLASGSDGKIRSLGLAETDYGSNLHDLQVRESSLNYAADTQVPAICSARGNSLQGYAVETGQQTRGFLATDTQNFGTSPPTYGVSIGANYVGASNVNQQTLVACSNVRILVSNGDTISLVNPSTAAVLWTINPSSTVSALALSGDSNWFAYTTSVDTKFGWANNGTTMSPPFTNPSGTIREAALDYSGQHLYVVSSTNIAFFDTSQETGGPATPVPTDSSSGSGSGSATGSGTGNILSGPAQESGNPLGNMVNTLNAAWGFDWSWIIGALFLGIFLWKAKDVNVFIQAVFTVIITVANVKLGLWADWSFILMVFLIIAIAGNRLFGDKNDGEAAA